ncbi:MAG TPA: response regulator [Gaiellaceae bacterium]|nr:response regulator [Gaiellaceae bacterium]
MDALRQLVLAADDDADILLLVRLRLERLGFDVLTAPDGVAALELVRARAPALAILDVSMPFLTGIEVTQTLRDEGSSVPVILLTARARGADADVGIEAGAIGYVTKPFSTEDLDHAVRKALAVGV